MKKDVSIIDLNISIQVNRDGLLVTEREPSGDKTTGSVYVSGKQFEALKRALDYIFEESDGE